MYRYYKFERGDGAIRRDGATFEYLDKNGDWKEDFSIMHKFIGGDCDFDGISEEEAEAIVIKRKTEAL